MREIQKYRLPILTNAPKRFRDSSKPHFVLIGEHLAATIFSFQCIGELFSCDKQRGLSAANSFPAINSADYQRRTPRHDYSIMFVQRKAPRRDYSLMFVQRRAPRHDYSIMFVQRRAPRRDYTIMFVQRRAPRRQPWDTEPHEKW